MNTRKSNVIANSVQDGVWGELIVTPVAVGGRASASLSGRDKNQVTFTERSNVMTNLCLRVLISIRIL